MEYILGGLAFAAIMAAQFLAVVALHPSKRDVDPSGKADLRHRARAGTPALVTAALLPSVLHLVFHIGPWR